MKLNIESLRFAEKFAVSSESEKKAELIKSFVKGKPSNAIAVFYQKNDHIDRDADLISTLCRQILNAPLGSVELSSFYRSLKCSFFLDESKFVKTANEVLGRVSLPSYGIERLVFSANNGELDSVKTLILEKSFSASILDEAIKCAVYKGHLDVLYELLSIKQISDETLSDALSFAACEGNLEVFKMLIFHTAIKSNMKLKAAEAAIENLQLEILKELINDGFLDATTRGELVLKCIDASPKKAPPIRYVLTSEITRSKENNTTMFHMFSELYGSGEIDPESSTELLLHTLSNRDYELLDSIISKGPINCEIDHFHSDNVSSLIEMSKLLYKAKSIDAFQFGKFLAVIVIQLCQSDPANYKKLKNLKAFILSSNDNVLIGVLSKLFENEQLLDWLFMDQKLSSLLRVQILLIAGHKISPDLMGQLMKQPQVENLLIDQAVLKLSSYEKVEDWHVRNLFLVLKSGPISCEARQYAFLTLLKHPHFTGKCDSHSQLLAVLLSSGPLTDETLKSAALIFDQKARGSDEDSSSDEEPSFEQAYKYGRFASGKALMLLGAKEPKLFSDFISGASIEELDLKELNDWMIYATLSNQYEKLEQIIKEYAKKRLAYSREIELDEDYLSLCATLNQEEAVRLYSESFNTRSCSIRISDHDKPRYLSSIILQAYKAGSIDFLKSFWKEYYPLSSSPLDKNSFQNLQTLLNKLYCSSEYKILSSFLAKNDLVDFTGKFENQDEIPRHERGDLKRYRIQDRHRILDQESAQKENVSLRNLLDGRNEDGRSKKLNLYKALLRNGHTSFFEKLVAKYPLKKTTEQEFGTIQSIYGGLVPDEHPLPPCNYQELLKSFITEKAEDFEIFNKLFDPSLVPLAEFLSDAAFHGSIKHVEKLLSAGASVSEEAILNALAANNFEAFFLIIRQPGLAKHVKESVFMEAFSDSQFSALKPLINSGDIEIDWNALLDESILSWNIEKIEFLKEFVSKESLAEFCDIFLLHLKSQYYATDPALIEGFARGFFNKDKTLISLLQENGLYLKFLRNTSFVNESSFVMSAYAQNKEAKKYASFDLQNRIDFEEELLAKIEDPKTSLEDRSKHQITLQALSTMAINNF